MMLASASLANTGDSSPYILFPKTEETSIAQSIVSSGSTRFLHLSGYTPIVGSQYFLASLAAFSGTPPYVHPVSIAIL
jgi:hypothetical protein